MLRNFFFGLFFLTVLAAVSVVIRAQVDQSEFISIDCGIDEGSNYMDPTTGLRYSSDAGFVNTGVSRTVAPNYNSVNTYRVQHLLNLRSFPQGTRNCYNLRPSNGKNNKYLIRVRFLYGNYDGQNRLPEFDMHIGVEYWDTVIIGEESALRRFEIIHMPTSDYINVCFINTGRGTPFVSALELRPLPDNIYRTRSRSESLNYQYRWDFGSTANHIVRYSDDIYDRMWATVETNNTRTLSTSSTIRPNNWNIPSSVMSTAVTPQDGNNSLAIYWSGNTTYRYYIYAHFAEVEVLGPNETRSFNMYLNGELWYGPLSPANLSSDTVSREAPETCTSCNFTISRTQDSTHPPSLNAFEIYRLENYTKLETDQNDVDGIMRIRSEYNLTRNWQGDPCGPEAYVWNGINCSNDSLITPRIISLNLSSSGLTGRIAAPIDGLQALEYLDLSNNSLTGQVPDFLSQMASLRVLRLNGNNFTGSIPAELIERSRNGLRLSIDGLGNNTNPCQSTSCEGNRNKSSPNIVPIVASIVAVSLGLAAVGFIFLWAAKHRKKQGSKSDTKSMKNEGNLVRKNRQFTYSEVLNITNNFEKVIGKGGFGTVYYGYVGDTQVAVKMLSPSSSQGYKEFQAEASLLMSVYHKNLSTLVGYCNEGTNMGIVYEYMSNGNLDQNLSDRNLYTLGWKERLRIANDAAQGLEYLHHSCKPPIVHRDVKSNNILLDEKFEAKLTDFGLSRAFSMEGDSHVSTVVAGTPGYLDPEYFTTNRLTEKSDVYGFGVVLLEMITGRPALAKNEGRTHVIQWVTTMLNNGDISDIVDPRIEGNFDINSAWKVLELAMACASSVSATRPSMKEVVLELNSCLETEMGPQVSFNIQSDSLPGAR